MNSTGYVINNIGSNTQPVQVTATCFNWKPHLAMQNNTNYAPQVTWDHTCGLHPHKTYHGLPSHYVIKPQYSTLSVPRCFQEYYGGSNKDFYKLYDDQGVVAWGTTPSYTGSCTVSISSPWSQTAGVSAYSAPWYQPYVVSSGSISAFAGPYMTISDFIGQRPSATVMTGGGTLVCSGQKVFTGYW